MGRLPRLTDTIRRGAYIIVDAACTLPAFILAMALMLSLINQAGIEDKMYSQLVRNCNTSAVALASHKSSYRSFLVGTGSTENGVKQLVTYRPFWGEKLLKTSGDEIVYVFPNKGIRYHVAGCSTMQEGQIVKVLNSSVRRKYSPCKICKPQSLPDGANIYIYGKSSSVYHRKSCASITKSFEAMEKSEAIKAGYTPCLLCIGDEE